MTTSTPISIAADRGLPGTPGDELATTAPMLFTGEELGTGDGPACDLAVDPLEGTRLCAQGEEGAVSVLAAASPGSLWATPRLDEILGVEDLVTDDDCVFVATAITEAFVREGPA